MTRLALSFLGGFQAALGGRPLTEFKSNKVRALLAYLAVEADRPHRREALAGLLWPEWTDRDALSNLRYSLASLRKTLGDRSATTPFLLITHDSVQFNQASDTWLDVAELERQIVDTRDHWTAGTGVDALRSALSLYQGGFLEGFSVGDAAPFEEWALLRGEHIARQVMSTLSTLVAELEALGDYKEAQAYARQQVALEPWNEAAHRSLMRALALDDQRNAALHQFQVCRRILNDELGVAPGEETLALYETIRSGEPVDKGASLCRPASPVFTSPQQPGLPSSLVVAREEQLARLNNLLAEALAGMGRVVFITGEAGSGKTVLLGEFSRRAMKAHADLLVARGTCDAAIGIGDPYLPFREILQLLTGDIESRRVGGMPTLEQARRLWAAIPDAVQALVEQGPDLIDTFVPGASLSLRTEAFARQAGRGAWWARLQQLRQSTAGDDKGSGQALQLTDIFEQVTHVLQELARRHPLCLVLDDLQWADAGSVSLLLHFGRRIANSRILVVAAYRPDAIAAQAETERHPLELVVNELQRMSGKEPIDLDACDGRLFVEALLDTEPNRLGVDFRELLFGRTEGHPLFTVELLRAMEERGDLVRDAQGCWTEAPTLQWDRLPARVEAAIAERLGRLPDHCRRLVAAASVEGQEFTAEVVARALDSDERTIFHCLSSELGERHRLVTAVGLVRRGARRLSRYRFKHDLFRRYLYSHLDPIQRGRLHEAIGDALESLHEEGSEELEALTSRLAWHFEAAGLADRAAQYHLQAGQRAAYLAAHEDAIDHLTRGLSLLAPLPDSPERASLKLDLLVALEMPVALAHSFWALERIRAVEQVYELAQHPALESSPQRGTALATVASFAMWSADLERGLEIGSQLLGLAETSGDAHQLLVAHFLLGGVRFLSGRLVLAREHFDRALALHDRQSFDPQDTVFGFHAGVISLVWQSAVLWQLGYPDQGSRVLQEALTAAEQSNHAITLAFARASAAIVLYVVGRDAAAGWQQADALRRLRQVGPSMESWADSVAGRSATGQGQDDEESLRQMQEGLVGFKMLGGQVGRAGQLMVLAQSYARAGQVGRGLEAMDEALVWVGRSGVTTMQAEAYRLRGELLVAGWPREPEAVAAAEASFREAITIARRQGARWWELRATVSLCRLLQGQSIDHDARLAEARQMLVEIYSWFSEGFDTLDLREARELLEQLEAA